MNQNALKLNLIALAILAITFAFESTTVAQNKSLFRQASRNKGKLNLTETAGPWLIMCAAFDGEDGRQQAINLANELLTTHGLTAYVFRQHFNFASDIPNRGRGYQKPLSGGKSNLRQREMKLANDSQKTEYAVLVGDYKTLDSKRAQNDLKKIKQLQPESLKIYSGSIDDTPQAGERIRANSEAMFGSGGDVKHVSAARTKFPLRLALLVTNPMIPDDVLAQSGVDQDILRLNRDMGLNYNLLDNPKAYTLKIASFSGEVFIRPEDIEEEKSNLNRLRHSDKDSSMAQAAKRANILTEYLRKKDIEAWQFHDRFSSYVCIGGFDWVSEGEGPDARPNPEVTKLAQVFAAKPVGGGQVTTFALPRRLLDAGVTCDSNPLTVAVPRAKSPEGRRALFPSRLR